MRAEKKLWHNRREKKEWARRLQSEDPGLTVIHPEAAGIDVGNSAHYAAVRPDRTRNRCGASSVLRRTCIGWPTGYGAVG
jgi:hypothetical protein